MGRYAWTLADIQPRGHGQFYVWPQSRPEDVQDKGVDVEFRGNATRGWREVMKHWLHVDGVKHHPATWEGLYTLVRDCDLRRVAMALLKTLEHCQPWTIALCLICAITFVKFEYLRWCKRRRGERWWAAPSLFQYPILPYQSPIPLFCPHLYQHPVSLYSITQHPATNAYVQQD
jgi:hypothetical protein